MSKLIHTNPPVVVDASSNSELSVFLYEKDSKENKGEHIGYIWRDNLHMYRGKPMIRYRLVNDPNTKIRGNVTSEEASITQMLNTLRNMGRKLGTIVPLSV